MKKQITIISVIALLIVLSACAKLPSNTEQYTNVVGMLSDLSCLTAEKDGNLADEDLFAMGDKYGFANSDELIAAIPKEESEQARVKTLTSEKVKATCSDLFSKANVGVDAFVDQLLKSLMS